MNEHSYKYTSKIGLVPILPCCRMWFHHYNATSITPCRGWTIWHKFNQSKIKPQLLWHLSIGENYSHNNWGLYCPINGCIKLDDEANAWLLMEWLLRCGDPWPLLPPFELNFNQIQSSNSLIFFIPNPSSFSDAPLPSLPQYFLCVAWDGRIRERRKQVFLFQIFLFPLKSIKGICHSFRKEINSMKESDSQSN